VSDLSIERLRKLSTNTLDSVELDRGRIIMRFGAEDEPRLIQLSLEHGRLYVDVTTTANRRSFLSRADAWARAVSFIRRAGLEPLLEDKP
jgi:hypothetical protein